MDNFKSLDEIIEDLENKVELSDALFETINKDLDKNTIILDSMDIQYQRMLMFNQSSKKTKFENEKLRFYVVRSR